uniref:Secreted protein n=1 Tax=Bursaphelenchus xylophilus TaxID=6326 RepID=A0A1I7SNP7_BURXY
MRGRIFTGFKNGGRFLTLNSPTPAILVVVGLLDVEILLIREQDLLSSLSCGATLEFSTFFEPYLLVVFREALGLLELVRLALWCITGHSSTSCCVDDGLPGNLFHGHHQILLHSLFDDLKVARSVQDALSSISWTLNIVAKLVDSFGGFWHSRFSYTEQFSNLTLSFFFPRQV